jgi:hypothetical protein
LKKQYAQLQANKLTISQTIEQEDREYEEIVATNCELKEQRDKLVSRLTEMKDKIEILHAEIGREGASNLMNSLLFFSYLKLFVFLSLHSKSKPRRGKYSTCPQRTCRFSKVFRS